MGDVYASLHSAWVNLILIAQQFDHFENATDVTVNSTTATELASALAIYVDYWSRATLLYSMGTMSIKDAIESLINYTIDTDFNEVFDLNTLKQQPFAALRTQWGKVYKVCIPHDGTIGHLRSILCATILAGMPQKYIQITNIWNKPMGDAMKVGRAQVYHLFIAPPPIEYVVESPSA